MGKDKSISSGHKVPSTATHKAEAGRHLGVLGESEVCEWLVAHGHTILERNWRCGHLETDIISLAPDGIHFVEVKSRTAPTAMPPQEQVDRIKQKKIEAAAVKYLSKCSTVETKDLEVWLDIAAVTFNGGDMEIEYFPGAWTPIYYK